MSRHGKIAENKALLTINIEADVKEKLRALARQEKRTVSNFVAWQLGLIVERAQQTEGIINSVLPASAGADANRPTRQAKGKK